MANRKGSCLSVEEQQTILDLHKDRWNISKIATETGRSKQSIRRVLKQGEAKPRKRKLWGTDDQRELERLIDEGVGSPEIARRMGWDIQTIYTKQRARVARKPSPEEAHISWEELMAWTTNDLQVGEKYFVNLKRKDKNAKRVAVWSRPLVYEGVRQGARGISLFMFRSNEGGWRETYTLQQVKDRVFEQVKRK